MFTGDGQPLLKIVELLHLGGIIAEILIQQQNLAVDFILLRYVSQQLSSYSITSLLLHHGQQCIASSKNGLNRR